MNPRFRFRAWFRNYYIYDIQNVGVDKNIKCNEDCFGDFLYDNDCVIEQCTGLYDRKGKFIYEGDILRCIHSEIMKYKIYWLKNGFRMQVYGSNNEFVDDTVLFLDTNILEVIGNIHENSDLLENEE